MLFLTSSLDPVIFPSKMTHFLKTPTSFATKFHCTSHPISTSSNHYRKLSATPIQQKNRVQVPMSGYHISKLNRKWTECTQKHDAVWSKRLQELDAMWSKHFQEADSLHLRSAVELEAMRFERSQKQCKENQYLSLQIQDLRVGSPLLLPLYFF